MDRRKVQSVGGGTYTVSLPKEWAESREIDAGDAVGLHTHLDGVLVVEAAERESDTAERIRVPAAHDDADALERTLRAAYASGVTEIVLDAREAFDPEQRRVVDRVVRNLTGVSVAEAADGEIRVQTLLDADEVSVQQSVRQLKFVALSMHRTATAALADPASESDPSADADANARALAERDEQADRLYAMIDRSFARGLARLDEVDALGVTRPALFELWTATRELERVADHAEGIAAAAVEAESRASIGESLADDVRDVGGEARDIVADGVSVVVGDADAATARAALAARDEVREDVAALDDRLAAASGDAGGHRLALERLRRTAEHGGNIAERGLQRALRESGSAGPDQDGESDPDSGRDGDADRNQESRASTGG
jgi:phosphate uptake regulator